MSFRPHGRATVDPSNPRAWGHCERCYTLVNHSELRWQMRYAGPNLVNTGKLVCTHCLDVPNPQERTIVLQPDPIPIKNPRPVDRSVLTDYIVTDNDYYIDDDLDEDFVKAGGNG